MKYEINKESIDKLFPKTDIMGYESPIHLITDQIATQISRRVDENIWEAVVKTEVVVDKDELIKALRYDRDQYDKGYVNGYNADKWISCKDRLPKVGTTCIVTVGTRYAWEKEYTYDTDVALYYADGEWETWNDWNEANEVIITHWQPLPKIPNKFA